LLNCRTVGSEFQSVLLFFATAVVNLINGINKGVVIPLMGIEDIAPLVANLQQIELPSSEGILLSRHPGEITLKLI
jgi:hypothetical protein